MGQAADLPWLLRVADFLDHSDALSEQAEPKRKPSKKKREPGAMPSPREKYDLEMRPNVAQRNVCHSEVIAYCRVLYKAAAAKPTSLRSWLGAPIGISFGLFHSCVCLVNSELMKSSKFSKVI